MIIFEDDEFRVEQHESHVLIHLGFSTVHMRDIYRCGAKWSDGSACDSVSIYQSINGFICFKAFRKVPMSFICKDCANGDHIKCTRSTCDCQHRTDDGKHSG